MGVLLGALVCALVLGPNPNPNGLQNQRPSGASVPSSSTGTDPGGSSSDPPSTGGTSGGSPSDPPTAEPTGSPSAPPTDPGPTITPGPTDTPSDAASPTGTLPTGPSDGGDGPALRGGASLPPEEATPSDSPLVGGARLRPGPGTDPTPGAPRPHQAQPSSRGGWSLLNTPGLGPRLVVAGLIGLIISVAGLVTVFLRRRRW